MVVQILGPIRPGSAHHSWCDLGGYLHSVSFSLLMGREISHCLSYTL